MTKTIFIIFLVQKDCIYYPVQERLNRSDRLTLEPVATPVRAPVRFLKHCQYDPSEKYHVDT
jgi:hypothetical protein